MVSVIVPVYNNKNTIERAVRSVVHDPLVSEILVVDDGSRDGSLEIAHGLSGLFPKVSVLGHEERRNKGAAASRNLGLSLSKNPWIQFLDADDEVLPGKIEGQIALVSRDTPFVVGNSVHVFSDGKRHPRKSDKEVWKGLIRSKLGDTCANLWNRQFLVEVGAWDESLASSQEYDLMFRLVCLNPKVVFDGRYLTLIYKTANSISTSPDKRAIRIHNWLALRERIRMHLIAEKIFDLKKRYYWSGAVGQFCVEHGVDVPSFVESSFFRLYRSELSLKMKISHILKPRV